jgi:CRP-like cAMP-binding protein
VRHPPSPAGQFRKDGEPDTLIPGMNQEILAHNVGTTRGRVSFFMKRFRTRGVIEYGSGMSGIIVPCSLLNVVLK